ncbi:hypothetical protein FNAPI_7735 [Fusarium napiforme]|uniref:Uncharacterized protein n=1 Tax=Fusarium napiforme TaxID=42672 RepID=A0A8H5JAD4_9HYPO|nr:hypothetical protein FNAPI_7735 [Fusarium napiforme]
MLIMRYLNAASLVILMSAFVHASPMESIERRSFVDPIKHGNYGRSLGKIYRYHEVSDGLFAGVTPEDWDDTVHVKGAWLAKRSETNESPPSLDVDLFNRDISSACATGLACAKAAAQVLGSPLYQLGVYLLNKVREYGPQVLDTLNRPFWANFAGVGGQNFVVTGIFKLIERKSDNPPPVEQCSLDYSQVDLMTQMVAMACSSNPERRAFSQSITLPDGSVYELNMAAAPGQTLSDSDVCDAPNTGS